MPTFGLVDSPSPDLHDEHDGYDANDSSSLTSFSTIDDEEIPQLDSDNEFYDSDANESAVLRCIKSETIESIFGFRHKTGTIARYAEVPYPDPRHDAQSTPGNDRYLMRTADYFSNKDSAIYVLGSLGRGYVLLHPINAAVVGTDRPDLQTVSLTRFSEDELNPGPVLLENYIPGDLFEVKELVRKRGVDPNDILTDMTRVNIRKAHNFWMVAKFTLLKRNILKNKVIIVKGPYSRNNTKKMVCLADGLDKPVHARARLFPNVPNKFEPGSCYVADIFFPISQGECRSSIEKEENEVEDVAPYFVVDCGNFQAQAMQVKPLPERMKTLLQTAPFVFEKESITSKFAYEALCFSTHFGLSGTLAMKNHDKDPRRLFTKIEEAIEIFEGKRVRFTIGSPDYTPKRSLWAPGTEIQIELSGGSAFCAKIELAEITEEEKHCLEITARVWSTKMQNTDLLVQSAKIMVSQPYETDTRSLDLVPKFARILKLSPQSNCRVILEALNGGKSIKYDFEEHDELITLSSGLTLSKKQSEYVHAFSKSRCPAMLVNAAFGTGKTTMIVAAAVQAASRNQDSRRFQLVLCMTNFAVNTFVKTYLKQGLHLECPIVRLVTQENHEEMDLSLHSPVDLPLLVSGCLQSFVTDYDGNREECRRTAKLSLVQAALWHLNARKELPDNLSSTTSTLIPSSAPRQSIIETFLAVRKPKVLVATISSVLNFFQTAAFNSRNVKTVQIDDAHLMPCYAVLSLLFKFPSARFAFLGDTCQFPPYKHNDLPEKLDSFAVGDTLYDACHNSKFPQFHVNDVYNRKTRVIEILSKVFYNGKLASVPSIPNDREYLTPMGFQSFPIQLFATISHHEIVLESLRNRREAKQALNFARDILSSCGRGDVGILCFYKAQAALVSSLVTNEDVFVGTVDSSQHRVFDAVIICTSRSRRCLTTKVLENRFRINVALSRAKELTVILDPVWLLHTYENWRDVISLIPKQFITTPRQIMYRGRNE